jgi:hypothetical protein
MITLRYWLDVDGLPERESFAPARERERHDQVLRQEAEPQRQLATHAAFIGRMPAREVEAEAAPQRHRLP